MQQHCRPRLHAASKKDDAETADIDELAKLFAQYAQYAKSLPAKSARIKRSIEFDCAEDSDEAAANWTEGTVPMCERWFVHTVVSLSFKCSMFAALSFFKVQINIHNLVFAVSRRELSVNGASLVAAAELATIESAVVLAKSVWLSPGKSGPPKNPNPQNSAGISLLRNPKSQENVVANCPNLLCRTRLHALAAAPIIEITQAVHAILSKKVSLDLN